jgi:hypothetical protein
MRMPNLTGAFLIALLTAGALHLSVQPAAASTGDAKSFCAHLAAVELSIASSGAPDFAKSIAIAAIYGTKKAAGCEQLTEY